MKAGDSPLFLPGTSTTPATARMAREPNARYGTSPARAGRPALLCGRPTDVCGSLPEENRARFFGNGGLCVDLGGARISAHRRRARFDPVEPALQVREVVQALLLLLVRHD